MDSPIVDDHNKNYSDFKETHRRIDESGSLCVQYARMNGADGRTIS